MALRLALIDNYDSYTHNLSHLLAKANKDQPPETFFADSYSTLSQLIKEHGHFDAFILSPGPGNPTSRSDFTNLQRQILSSSYPIFAVCLGHQALCHLHGASIHHLPSAPAHGIVSEVVLSSAARKCPLFQSIPPAFTAVRYHSLVASHHNLRTNLVPTAWTMDTDHRGVAHRILMAVTHRSLPHFGVQFHPESICTEHGSRLAYNFTILALRLRNARSLPLPLPVLQDKAVAVKRVSRLVTLVRTSAVRHTSPFPVFSQLFAKREGAFWLDSNTADKGTSPVSPRFSFGSEILKESQQAPKKDNHLPKCNARFSIMGACEGPMSELITYDVNQCVVTIRRPCSNRSGASQITKWSGSIFDYLKEQLSKRFAPAPSVLPCQMNGGYVGYLGYELKRDIFGVQNNEHSSSLPDAWLVFADRLVIFDHLEGKVFLVALLIEGSEAHSQSAESWFDRTEAQLADIALLYDDVNDVLPGSSSPSTPHEHSVAPLQFTPERSRSEYLKDIAQTQRAIRYGETYEACLTNRLKTKVPSGQPINALQLYSALRKMNAAPYSAFLQVSKYEAVCCTSPERFLTIRSDGNVESKPIKGTRPRGRSFAEDEALRSELQQSEKDRSENLMIVDLVRNDLSRTCSVKTVEVPNLMHVESYATVHQLVSNVTGRLRKDCTVVDCVRAAYPMGSMTGAPKIRTMQIIDSLERSPRGVYSGTIGYLSVCEAADLNVVIRTAIVSKDTVSIGVGGAIIALSSPEDEYDETILKGKALMQAVALHSTGYSDAYFVQHERPIVKP